MKIKKDLNVPINELLQKRWSPRAFANRPVEPVKLTRLFEAARWAPSSFNDQPWHFLYAAREDEEAFEKLLDCLSENNRKWAGEAPVLMLAVTRTFFTKNEKPNRHAWHDLGQAIAYLTFQATEMDLYLHQMAGFSPERAREHFAIPEGYDPATAIALGYLGDPADLPAPFGERELKPQERRPLSSFVFRGSWPEDERPG